MIKLTKDGIIEEVQSEVQAKAYKANGWTIVVDTEKKVDEPEIPAVEEEKVEEVKAPTRRGRKRG